ncbi:MAG TPA: twin-arginine translocase subunit TatC [Geminicoccus sp.]|jgi:sec-independent protein translocase protein TatC|uniref:twin-arginine translocase subunit TatC n=1 Tax=Geminicoccus sp. TaxID=2024832 RepID=UPI002E2F9BEB|nr:twin-arginine translocase subunit TatC [Geminicoccus sp.]HEX2529177.1 twin-arginine translocase subunit TatC [Geminicoccus sp.]
MAIIKDIDDREMPLLDHLLELRNRLIWSIGALFIGFLVCYAFSEQIYQFLVHPLQVAYGNQTGRRMIYTGLTEAFFTYLKVAMWGGVMLGFPIIATQLWMFIAPGLYKHEKQAFLPFLLATPVLFFLGAALCYYFVFPLAFHFFLSFESGGGNGEMPIELEARVSEYLDLVMKMVFAFGLCFQLPVALTLMGRVGIIGSAGLIRNRRYAIVGVFVLAAIVTPPDVISQISLAVPILILYEISIIAVKMVERKRREAEAAEEAEAAAAAGDDDQTPTAT